MHILTMAALMLLGIPTLLPLKTGMYAYGSESLDFPEVQWLFDIMDQYHKTYGVYFDGSSGGNHFNCRGDIGSSKGLAQENDDCTIEPHSGLSCIRITLKPADSQWAGTYFLNGILQGLDRRPTENWGDTPHAGINLTGATKLTFWAKGDTGTEQVQFYAFGVGRNPNSGTPTKPYPDSSPQIGTGPITLSSHWKMFTLDVSTANLSYVLGGFGWSARTKTSTPVVFYLDDIHYDLPKLDSPRFLNSYKTIHSDIAANTILRNTAYTYDNAIAIQSFLAVGENERARLIADALVYAQNHDRYFTDGRIRNAYQSGELVLAPGWAPNGKVGTVRMPGWRDGGQWFEDESAVGTSTGNMAWSMLALVSFHDTHGGSQYLDAAARMGEWIENHMRDNRGSGGYMGGYTGLEPDQTLLQYKSTEHNLDLCAAFQRLFDITKDPKWNERSQYARGFVMSMWNETEGRWHIGTTKDGVTLNTHRVLDCQPWALLALKELAKSYHVALNFAEAYNRLPGTWGFDFDSDQDGIWYEGTAQMATAYLLTGQEEKAGYVFSALLGGRAPSGGMYATNIGVLTTGLENPGGSAWLYYGREHVGATGWTVIAKTRTNPFWLGTPDGKIGCPLSRPWVMRGNTGSPLCSLQEKSELGSVFLRLKEQCSAVISF